MAHFDSQPSTPEPDADAGRNSRYGLVLFAAYSLLYGTFMILNAFWPQVMETIVFAGMNLAVLYGLALIAAAFVIALIYVWLCRAPVDPEGRL